MIQYVKVHFCSLLDNAGISLGFLQERYYAIIALSAGAVRGDRHDPLPTLPDLLISERRIRSSPDRKRSLSGAFPHKYDNHNICIPESSFNLDAMQRENTTEIKANV
jgi:hypothetical protein